MSFIRELSRATWSKPAITAEVLQSKTLNFILLFNAGFVVDIVMSFHSYISCIYWFVTK